MGHFSLNDIIRNLTHSLISNSKTSKNESLSTLLLLNIAIGRTVSIFCEKKRSCKLIANIAIHYVDPINEISIKFRGTYLCIYLLVNYLIPFNM